MDLHNLIDDLIENGCYYDFDLDDMSVDKARDLLLVTAMEISSSYCKDCGMRICDKENKEWFIIEDSLWESLEGEVRVLCIGCLETRIGRQLVASDFPRSIPLNVEIADGSFPASERLRSRILDMSEPAAVA